MSQSSFQGFLSPRPDKKGGGSNIKSVQNGVASFNGTAQFMDVTIAAVSLSGSTRAVARVGWVGQFGDTLDDRFRITILNATTIRLSRDGTGSQTADPIYWEVIEYNNVKSLQTGQSIYTSTANTLFNQDITISAIALNKSTAFISYSTNNGSTGTPEFPYYLSSATNLRIAVRFGGTVTYVFEWQVIEFN